MPILVNCTCGKRMMVPDAKAGRYVQCPACGQSILTSVGGRKVERRDTSAPAKVSINWAPILKIGSVVAIIAIVALVYFGPVRVWSKFDAMNPQMRSNIADVTTRGLEFATGTGMFQDPRALGFHMPGVPENDMTIMRPVFSLSLPADIQFYGNSSEGEYKGTYNVATQTVTVDAEIGRMTLPGVGAVSPASSASKPVRITGTSKNGKLDVEVNGTKVPKESPKWPPRDDR